MPAVAVGSDLRGFRNDWPRYVSAFASMVRSRLLDRRPFFLAHAVTFGCNSRCRTCSYWKLTPRMSEDLATPEVYALLDEAYDAGMRGYYLFGGEPLVRKDVGELVHYARRRGFLTVMNTNGSTLAGKAEALRDLDFAFVSLDHPSRYHDEIRGRPGSFDEVLHGIERLREVAGTRVALVTTISTLNFDVIEPMARLAQRLGVMVSYNSVEPTLDFGLTDDARSPNLQLGLDPERLREFYRVLLRLKREGYPLLETEGVLADFARGRPWRCEFPKMFVYVSPDKKIYSCDYAFDYDLRHGSFEGYFSSPAFRAHLRSAESCNRCIRTCVRGYSYTYELRLSQLVDLAGEARRLFRPRPKKEPGPGPEPRGARGPSAFVPSRPVPLAGSLPSRLPRRPQ